MRVRVRPVTALTRRKQLEVKIQIPKRVFDDLMEPLLDKGVVGLERGFMGTLKPTSYTQRVLRYDYILNKGSLSDAFFHLETMDPLPTGRMTSAKRQYKRGLGCARLHLSAAAGARGEKAMTLAMVCGAVIICYREPTRFRAMGTLSIKMFVLSMDHTGHIIWPITFAAKAMASLRNQARTLLTRMMADPLFPISNKMKAALDPKVTAASVLNRPPLKPATAARTQTED